MRIKLSPDKMPAIQESPCAKTKIPRLAKNASKKSSTQTPQNQIQGQ